MHNEEKRPLLTPQAKKTLVRALVNLLPAPGRDIYLIVEDLQRSRSSFDEKIEKAAESLQETSRLVDELQTSLTERAEKLKVLKDQVERYAALSDVEENKAKAILSQLEITLNKGKGRERWISFGINIVAGLLLFVLGLVLSPYFQTLLGISPK